MEQRLWECNTEQKIIWDKKGFWYNGVYRELSHEIILLVGSRAEEADSQTDSLSEKTGGSLSEEATGDLRREAAPRAHVYHDIHAAFSCPELARASLEHPVTIYIAPDVYWIDDPKASDIMQKEEGYPVPFGMYVTCKALRIVGLSDNPEDVVIAGNRGQSHACNGNYTMLHFQVDELHVSNITLGNYCSVDLVYPRNPALNYPKRTETITQAQLAFQEGEKFYAKNCRFISRLNLNPICGAKRALYDHCHFESTDDALNGNAVYVDCDFDFYGNRPFYQARETGAVLIGCIFHSRIKSAEVESYQYLTKEGGPVTLIDCSYESSDMVNVSWTKYPDTSLKCYQYQVSHNGKPVSLGGEAAAETVQLEGKKALEAYVFEWGGKRFANVGNLLGGSDDWDPMGVLEDARNVGKIGIPTLLRLVADQREVTSGEEKVSIIAESFLFSHESCSEKVSFTLGKGDEAYAILHQIGDNSCTVEGCNRSSESKKIVICACTESGLQAAVPLTVEPYLLEAPACIREPHFVWGENTITVHYELSVRGRADTSEISWYRCDDLTGAGAILCGVSKGGIPLRTYHLTEGDAGKYLKAAILPRIKGSLTGKAIEAVMTEPVEESAVDRNYLFTDFSEMPEENLWDFKKGSWIPDCAQPADIKVNSDTFGSWSMDDNIPAWKYGETGNGSEGVGLYQNTQGARLRYSPVTAHDGDMSMTVKADPAKTAGQGFGSAGQYLDLGIKFDTEKLSGYALRIIRIKEASDGVAMALVEYQDGRSRYLTGLQLTSCFLTGCTLKVALQGKKLMASVTTKMPQPVYKAEKGYVHEVKLEAEVESSPHGGILIWHTGTPGTGGWQNTTMLHSIEVEYGDFRQATHFSRG